MRRNISRILIALIILFSGCKDEEKEIPFNTAFYSESSVIFWTSNATFGDIQIYFNSTSAGTITSFTSSEPNCGAAGFVTVSAIPGNYYYTAWSSQSSYSSSGYIQVSGECTKKKLE